MMAEAGYLPVRVAEGSPEAVEVRYTYDPDFPDKALTIIPYKPGTNEVHRHWQAMKFDYHPPDSTAPGTLHHVYEVDHDGVTSRITRTNVYDAHGRVVKETFSNGAVRSFFYDARGNLVLLCHIERARSALE
jgi:YD repeat-containing protein